MWCNWAVSSTSSKGCSGGLRAVGEGSTGEGVCSHLSHHATAVTESHQQHTGGQSLKRTNGIEQSQTLLSDVGGKTRMCVGSGLALCTLQNAPLICMTTAAVQLKLTTDRQSFTVLKESRDCVVEDSMMFKFFCLPMTPTVALFTEQNCGFVTLQEFNLRNLQ